MTYTLIPPENQSSFWFEKQASIPALSKGCERMYSIGLNHWIFETIAIYQNLETFKNLSYQQWAFVRQENEVLIICSDISGNILQFLGADLIEYIPSFLDVSICVVGGKCMLLQEFEALET